MMVMNNQNLNMILMFMMIAFHLTLATNDQSNSWAGSKYQIQCTMCAACDNPCNQPTYSPPPPPPSPPPPPPPTQSYTPKPFPPICPPPPTPPKSGYYYPPPATTQGPNYYTYPPPAPAYNTDYPTPQPPNPIMPYFPYYYYSPPPPALSAAVSLSAATAQFLIHFIFLIFVYTGFLS